jgi:hypothetical protein
LTSKEGTAELSIPEPTIQKSQDTKIQMAWAPMDDTGCFDHVGWRKRSVYVPAVETVQQAEKLLMMLPVVNSI